MKNKHKAWLVAIIVLVAALTGCDHTPNPNGPDKPIVCEECGTAPCSCIEQPPVCADCGTAPCSCIEQPPVCADCGTAPCSCVEIEPLTDLQFPTIVTTGPNAWTHTFATSQTEAAIRGLSNQSSTMGERFATWENDLRTTGGTPEQIAFAEFVQTRQNNIQNAYRGSTVNGIRENVNRQINGSNNSDMNGLVNQVGSFFTDPKALSLFRIKITAFQDAHTLAQRRHYQSPAHQESAFRNLNTLTQMIEDAIGQSVFSQSTTPIAIARTLRGLLEAALPEELGPYRNDILQQLEDFTQFDGWTQDLRQLNYQLNITPLASALMKKQTFTMAMPPQEAAPVQTRGEVQAENGLHV